MKTQLSIVTFLLFVSIAVNAQTTVPENQPLKWNLTPKDSLEKIAAATFQLMMSNHGYIPQKTIYNKTTRLYELVTDFGTYDPYLFKPLFTAK